MAEPAFPNAEIIAVGSELLTPRRMDTNSLFLTDRLNALGVEVVRKTIVGDDRERLAAAIRIALSSAGIVILTGGLGPTEDDVTRDAVAAGLGLGMAYSSEIESGIAERFRRFGRRMAEINKRQAYVIEGAAALPNPDGTAPGQWIERQGIAIMLLPGPPGELKPMFENECIPRLERRLPQQAIRTRFFRVAGMAESDLDQLIAPVYTAYANPATTILAAAGDIQIHLRARCRTAEAAEARLNELAPRIEALLGDRIYSRTGDPMEVVVGELLRAKHATVSVAESCTGGLLGERITEVPGSSDYFVGGFITYTNRMKTELLGVPEELIEEHTAVSAPVAKAMAEGARRRTGSTYALSITGVAGPEGGSDQTPVGTVYIGVAASDRTDAIRVRFPGNRERVRGYAAQSALDLLRRALK
jgi:competence/damage-inducible protein CinA-like protein